MGLYRDHLLPRLTHWALSRRAFTALRREICSGVAGEVLEIGFGSGLNLPHLGAAVTELHAIDPCATAARLAARRIQSAPFPVTFTAGDATTLPFGDACFDAVVMTWTLCSVPDQRALVSEVRRVLRPHGALHLAEHGIAATRTVIAWQNRLTPLQQRMAGGCRLNTAVPALLDECGFFTREVQTRVVGGPAIAATQYYGRATQK